MSVITPDMTSLSDSSMYDTGKSQRIGKSLDSFSLSELLTYLGFSQNAPML